MKLNISLSHSREKRTCCNSAQNAVCHYKSEGREIMSLICSCSLLWIFNWSYLLKYPTLMFYKTSTQKNSSLWILSVMGIFASPLLKITWPMAYFSSQISILSSQLSGNHRRCLKERKKWLVLIWREKKVEEQGSYLWQNVIFSSVSACIFSQHVYSVTPSLPSFPWVNISALE